MEIAVETPDAGLLGAVLSEVEYGRRALRRWIDGLPLADPPRAAAAILGRLTEANAMTLPAALRLRFLDALAEPVARLLPPLRTRFAYVAGHCGQAEHAADLCTRLHTELATGYRLLRHGPAAARLRLRSTQDASARYHLLKHLAGGLVTARLRFRPAPAGLWREAHRCYLYFETAPAGGRFTLLRGPSLRERALALYRQMVLLSLAPAEVPYHKRYSDLLAAAEALAPRLRILGPGEAPPHADRTLSLRLDADRGPAYGDTRLRGPTCRRIDVSRIVDSIAAADTDPCVEQLCAALRPRRRREQRGECRAVTELALGFNGTVRLIGGADVGRKLPAPFDADAPAPLALDLEPEADADSGARIDAPARRRPHPTLTAAEILDTSDNGLRLKVARRNAGPIAPGQLVTLCRLGQATHFTCVRWLAQRGEHLDIGVEVIAADMVPLRLLAETGREHGAPLDALVGKLRGADAILLPRLPHAPERRFYVETTDARHEVPLGPVLFDSRLFQAFRLDATLPQLANRPPRPASQPGYVVEEITITA